MDWSVNRNAWIAVGNLQIGEQVKAKEQTVRLSCKEQIEGQKVYNFEVYREHTYLVSEGNLWVHNDYIKKYTDKYASATSFRELKNRGIPKQPEGISGTGAWGRDHIKWGSGYDAAINRMNNLTKTHLKGMTKEKAAEWSVYYKHVDRLSPRGNPSAAGRSILMKHIHDNFDSLTK